MIFIVRRQRVILDFHLAELYGVTTKRLNEQFKRNQARFPEDFAFQLREQEFSVLRSQFATSNIGRGGRRYLPWAFSEHGIAMLAGILNSETAIQINILIVREFIRMRAQVNSNQELERRISELESKCDARFKIAFDALRKVMADENHPRKRILPPG
jgi:hypothetical protein